MGARVPVFRTFRCPLPGRREGWRQARDDEIPEERAAASARQAAVASSFAFFLSTTRRSCGRVVLSRKRGRGVSSAKRDATTASSSPACASRELRGERDARRATEEVKEKCK